MTTTDSSHLVTLLNALVESVRSDAAEPSYAGKMKISDVKATIIGFHVIDVEARNYYAELVETFRPLRRLGHDLLMECDDNARYAKTMGIGPKEIRTRYYTEFQNALEKVEQFCTKVDYSG